MIPSKKFQRRKEDFVCKHCGTKMTGSGFTNHCHSCLWSKHVDISPGDRAGLCRGLMEPVGLEEKNGQRRLIHRCLACGEEKKNQVAPADDFETILAVSRKALEKETKI